MQFYHPEVLYALVLLLIPIIVHLFQLRKFQTEYFTNLKFLKKLSLQTRKSSRIKKWLVLATRLLALASIILAFSQPYFPSNTSKAQDVETIIYLDNSFSMEAIGKKGKLLERSIQELLESNFMDKNISLFTNSEGFQNMTKEDLQNIDYSGDQVSFETALLKASNSFSKDTSTIKKFLVISDLQQNLGFPIDNKDSEIDIYTYQLSPERKENLKIDTAYLSSDDRDSRILNVTMSNTGNSSQSTPVSLYNNDKLIGKTSASLEANSSANLKFPINDTEIPQGNIQIEDNGLLFDNTLYFSLNKILPIKVCSINREKSDFLARIYSSPKFDYSSFLDTAINYNALTDADVIILNEIPELNEILASSLSKLASKNKVFIIIPSAENLGSNFINFTKKLGISGFDKLQEQEKLITGIKFQHPIYKGVFEQQVKNFEYPKVQISYKLSSGSNTILSLQDNQPFLFQKGNSFIFSAPLNSKNSNFIQSPLVVPTFYKMAISNINIPPLYSYLGRENKITVPIPVNNDEVVKLSSEKISFIPQQKSSDGKIEITTNELPQSPDNYSVELRGTHKMSISYNVSREESKMVYEDLGNVKNIQQIEDLNEFFISEGYVTEKNTFWKWFVTFALLFLVIETLLLKYFK
ncbi:putative membrane protein (TIGR02226 family) [Gillisia sp. Hel_I_86]|uniref:BatA domain-containing protein n=1 Tax=Gillisia sp. Hel_I_86 TaxID=1249981 RepID=UPI00119944F3|nr:BatA domain-containing protein [Gillisia sp. Hel_I_86]TVZ28538.1 putative membrane protein (TIGR02226 family) [Gillisia sp. Hel_I_86]